MSDSSNPDPPKLTTNAEKPHSLEAAFRDFLASDQKQIPNIVVVPQANPPQAEPSRKGEFFSAGYALGLAALLTGSIFAAIAFGVSYSEGASDGKIGTAIEEAVAPLQQEIEALQVRVDALEAAQQSAQP